MSYTPSTNLSLPLITTGTESGTWGDVVDNGLTQYLDIAIAGGLSVSITTANVTLSNTAGTSSATNIGSTTAQYAILNITGNKTAARTLTLPASSKWYFINNAGGSTGGPFALTIAASGRSGVFTLADGERAVVAYNGTDYVKITPAITGAGVNTDITAITGTQPTTSGTAGSAVAITAGKGSSTTSAGSGGALSLTAGAAGTLATGSGVGGNVSLTAGAGNSLNAAGTPGSASVSAGASQIAGQNGGNITITATDGYNSTTTSSGGNVTITTGAAYGTTPGTNGALIIKSGSTERMRINSGGNAVFVNEINTPNTFSFKNRFFNGAMQIAQRATSATITAGSTIAAGYSTVDRWYVYCTGANVTAAQVAGTGAVKNRLQITGAASVTAVGIGQRIEQLNSYDLAGSTATLSVDISNSLLTTVTWTAYYANTADTFGTLASPTRTQIATGTFTVTSTITNYNTQISIPSAATTGIEVVFTVGAQTSGTWVVDNIQLEKGSIATSFDYRPYGTELALCQRYFQWVSFNLGFTATGAGASLGTSVPYKVDMRTVPSFATLSADPNVAQTVTNNGSNAFSATYSGVSAGLAALYSNTAGSCFVYGYRSAASAEL